MNQVTLPLLANLSGTPSDDGTLVALTLTAKNGTQFAVAMAANQLAGAVALMIRLAQRAATLQPADKKTETNRLAPIPASGLGVGKGRRETDALLSVQLGPMEMTFDTSHAALTAALQQLRALQGQAAAPAAAPRAAAPAAVPVARPGAPAAARPAATPAAAPRPAAPAAARPAVPAAVRPAAPAAARPVGAPAAKPKLAPKPMLRPAPPKK